MKLLLDEHLSPEIAESLRRRGHDAIAVSERDDLRGRKDVVVLVAAAVEGRVVVTQDVRDFSSLGSRRLPTRRDHVGIVLVPHRPFGGPRSAIGTIVRALEALLATHPGDEDLTGQVVWLRAVEGQD